MKGRSIHLDMQSSYKKVPNFEGHWVFRECLAMVDYTDTGRAFNSVQKYFGSLNKYVESGQINDCDAIRIIIALALEIYQKVNSGCANCERNAKHHSETLKLMSYEQAEVVRSLLCNNCHEFDLSVSD